MWAPPSRADRTPGKMRPPAHLKAQWREHIWDACGESPPRFLADRPSLVHRTLPDLEVVKCCSFPDKSDTHTWRTCWEN